MIRVRVFKEPLWMGMRIQFVILDFDPLTRKAAVATNFVMEEVDASGGFDIGKTSSMDIEGAQLLMDELWDCGLRPTEGAGSAGQLTSVQRHLEDMRAIAFNKSGVEAPKK